MPFNDERPWQIARELERRRVAVWWRRLWRLIRRLFT